MLARLAALLLLAAPAFAAQVSTRIGPMEGLAAPAAPVAGLVPQAIPALDAAAIVPGVQAAASAPSAAVGAAPSAGAMALVEGLFKEAGVHEALPDQALSAAFDGAPQNDAFVSEFLAPSPKNGRIYLRGISANPPADAPSDKKMLKKIAKNLDKIERGQQLLVADKERRVLVVLHGPNAAGKDGTIHDSFKLDLMGAHASGFKAPTPDEAKDHYLKRQIKKLFMTKGHITIFNRSHYEDLYVPAVYPEMYEKAWGHLPTVEEMKERIGLNNAFEKYLADRGWSIYKIYLHITKDEQGRRLRHRRDTDKKRFKLEPADLIEHNQKWAPTLEANGRMIAATDTPWARWFIIPANVKTYRNYAVTGIFKRLLKSFRLQPPAGKPGMDKAVIKR